MTDVVLGALIIFIVRVGSIALSTVRYMVMGRVHDLFTLIMASLEALAFALTISQVAANLNNIWNLMAYSLGFGVGTVVGVWIEKRLARGFATVHVVSMGKSLQIAKAVRVEGFGATRSSGEGSSGTVGLVRVVVRRRDAARVVEMVLAADPKAFVTVEETSQVAHGFIRNIGNQD